MARWREENRPPVQAVFGLAPAHRRLVLPPHGLARVNKDLQRRAALVGLFPNEASCLRLVSALLMGTREEWVLGRAYLTLA